MNTLTPEQKTQWVEALRSGKYQQGKLALKRHDIAENKTCYCCLGVLAEIVEPDAYVPNSEWYGRIDYEFHDDECTLPDELISSDEQGQLMYMNDTIGLSFEEIADVIEANKILTYVRDNR